MFSSFRFVSKFAPFSLKVGSWAWIPGSFFVIECFPCRLNVFDISEHELRLVRRIDFSVEGLFSVFSVTTDFNNQRVSIVIGSTTESISLKLFFEKNLLCISVSKGNLKIKSDGFKCLLESRLNSIWITYDGMVGEFGYLKKICKVSKKEESLSLFLGCNKEQNWNRISDRETPSEIFPLLCAMSLRLPSLSSKIDLNEWGSKLLNDVAGGSLLSFRYLWRAHFSEYGLPSWKDTRFQGLKPLFEGEGSPLNIISYVSHWLQSNFVIWDGDILTLFYNLPDWAISGRLYYFFVSELNLCVSVSWSKSFPRQCYFFSCKSLVIRVKFPKAVKVVRISCKKTGASFFQFVINGIINLFVDSNKTFSIDRFESK